MTTSLPVYTQTLTLAASTEVRTSFAAASYYTITTTIDALTLTSFVPGPVQTITSTQAASTLILTQTEPGSTQYITQTEREPASTQYITRTESQAVSTYYETTTISPEAITRTLTETSVAVSYSPIETTITGESSEVPPSMLRCETNMLKFMISDLVSQQYGDIACLYDIYRN